MREIPAGRGASKLGASLTLLAGTIGGLAIPAQATSIPGGVIEESLRSQAETYVAKPTSATAKPSCRAAEQYVHLINNHRYGEVATLFADDAIVLEPRRDGGHRGRAEINQFYTETIGRIQPDLVAVAYTGAGTSCFVALAIKLLINGQERYALGSVDHFLQNRRGKVTTMIAFARPFGSGVAPVSFSTDK
jgi:hypothetical protein